MKRFSLPVILTFGIVFFLFAEHNKIDSLENILKSADGQQQLQVLNALAYELRTLQPEKSYDYAGKALTLANKMQDTLAMGTANLNKGHIHYNKGEYAHALQYYIDGGKYFESIKNNSQYAYSLMLVGNVYSAQLNFDKALEYYESARAVKEKEKDTIGVAKIYANIGNIYGNRNDNEKALIYYLKALTLFEKAGNKRYAAMCMHNMGYAYNNTGKYQDALKYLQKSVEIQKELKDYKGLAESLSSMGYDYRMFKNHRKAMETFFEGMKYARMIDAKPLIRDAYKSIAFTYAEMGNHEKAFEYHQKFSEMKDSLLNAESSKQITEMQTKYETEKKDKEIQLLNKDKEIQQTEIAKQKLVRNAVTGGLLLVAAFALVLFNRFRLIRKQKKIIEVEREKSENLLLNILPKDTAEELKTTGKAKPQHYNMVTVMFTDFKGFTTIAEKMSAEELVSELDFIFKRFDEIISKYPIEKIKTIGDAYMCAGGLPVANITNPGDVVLAALEIQEFMVETQNIASREYAKTQRLASLYNWQIRIGIHTGPVIAGVVGDKKFAYDIWGDTVNTASRMESSGEAGKVNISGDTYRYLTSLSGFENLTDLDFVFRGKIPAKNKGEIEMFFVERNK